MQLKERMLKCDLEIALSEFIKIDDELLQVCGVVRRNGAWRIVVHRAQQGTQLALHDEGAQILSQ